MASVVWTAVLIVALALVIVLVIDNTNFEMEPGDRLMFGAIGIAGFTVAILTDVKDGGFLIG